MLRALKFAVVAFTTTQLIASAQEVRPAPPALPQTAALEKHLPPAAATRTTKIYRLRNVAAKVAAQVIDLAIRTKHKLKPQTNGLIVDSPVIIVPELKTNALIISAEPKYTNEINKLIEKIDATPQSITIQAKISFKSRDGKTSILSRPIIRTTDGQSASITIDEQDFSLTVEFTPSLQVDKPSLPKD